MLRWMMAAWMMGSSAWAQEAPAAGPVTYTVDNAGTWLWVMVKYDRNALMKGHDHAVRAMNVSGSVTWDPADPSACKIELSFPTSSLEVDTPGLRSRAGLEGETDAGDKEKIKSNMLGKAQLEADKFPTTTFSAISCAAEGDKVKVTGRLTLHGVARNVTSTMSITADGASFRGKGAVGIQGSSFGVAPFTAALGALRNDDNLTLHIDVAAKK